MTKWPDYEMTEINIKYVVPTLIVVKNLFNTDKSQCRIILTNLESLFPFILENRVIDLGVLQQIYKFCMTVIFICEWVMIWLGGGGIQFSEMNEISYWIDCHIFCLLKVYLWRPSHLYFGSYNIGNPNVFTWKNMLNYIWNL